MYAVAFPAAVVPSLFEADNLRLLCIKGVKTFSLELSAEQVFHSAVRLSAVALPLSPLSSWQPRDLSYAVTLPAAVVLTLLEADYVLFVNLILAAQQSQQHT